MLVNLHNSRLVPAAVAVIRRRENSHYVPILAPIVPLHYQLMRPRHERQPVIVIKRFADILSKCVPGSSGADSPPTPIIGIAPEEVAHGSLVGDFLDAIKGANVIEGVDGRGKTAVETEDLVIDKGR